MFLIPSNHRKESSTSSGFQPEEKFVSHSNPTWPTQIQQRPLKSIVGHSNPPMGHSNPRCMKVDNAEPEEGQSLVGHKNPIEDSGRNSNKKFRQRFQQHLQPVIQSAGHCIKKQNLRSPGSFPKRCPPWGRRPRKGKSSHTARRPDGTNGLQTHQSRPL